jgi:hypothetical protein
LAPARGCRVSSVFDSGKQSFFVTSLNFLQSAQKRSPTREQGKITRSDGLFGNLTLLNVFCHLSHLCILRLGAAESVGLLYCRYGSTLGWSARIRGMGREKRGLKFSFLHATLPYTKQCVCIFINRALRDCHTSVKTHLCSARGVTLVDLMLGPNCETRTVPQACENG